MTWFESLDTSSISRMLEEWKDSVVSLATLREKNIGTDAEISSEAYGKAIFWLVKAFGSRSNMEAPAVTPNGESGIDLESRFKIVLCPYRLAGMSHIRALSTSRPEVSTNRIRFVSKA